MGDTMLNPHQILDIAETANDEEIRAAYLTKLRENSPDSNQQQFQRIQQAYELIKDNDSRLRFRLFYVESITPEMIVQSKSIYPEGQYNKRVDLQTLQAMFKLVVAQAKPPVFSVNDE